MGSLAPFLSVICFLFTVATMAQRPQQQAYYFQQLNINKGLSQNTVNTILQDQKGFLWFGTKDGLNRYDGTTIKVFKDQGDNGKGLKRGFITTLFEERNGHIWVGTDAGLYIYNPKDERFTQFTCKTAHDVAIEKTVNKVVQYTDSTIFITVHGQGLFVYDTQHHTLQQLPFADKGPIRDIQVDDQGTLWVSFHKGLYRSTDQLKTLLPYRAADGTEPFKQLSVTACYFAPNNKLYVGTETQGLFAVDLSNHLVRQIRLSGQTQLPIFVRCLHPYSAEELWVGTETGVYTYDITTNHSRQLRRDPSDAFSIADNAIYSLYKDREGGMWIGSYFGGVNYYPKQSTYFEKYYQTNQPQSLQAQRVREICEGTNGTLWIGTEDAGLFKFDRATSAFEQLSASRAFSNVHALCMDGDQLWIGTFAKGLRLLDTRSGKIRAYRAEDGAGSITDNYVFSIWKARDGSIYIGTSQSLLRYQRASDTFERIAALDNNLVYDIKEDFAGNLWVATYTNGAYRYHAVSKTWEHYQHSAKEGSLPYDKVISIYEDSKHQIWLSTEGRGFCRFEPATKTFVAYGASEGLENTVVYQMTEDDRGFLWLTTNNGLIRFDPLHGRSKTFTTASGILSDQFNYKSSYKSRDGQILLGSISGLIAFNPMTFAEDHFVPPIYITDFFLFGKSPEVGVKGSPLAKSILYTDTLVLGHDQNHFSLRIAALGYRIPQIKTLQYKLEGIGEDWQDIKESSLISYANLAPGKYLFRVRSSDSDKQQLAQERQLHITILPPWYRSTMAYVTYLLLAMLTAYFLYRFFRNRQLLRQRLFVQEVEQNKEREIHEAKLGFFTHITHEIRTPLTLIKGPLENMLLRDPISASETKDALQLMKKNIDRLLNLINQLLDFRKTDQEGFLLNPVACHVADMLSDIRTQFNPLIQEYQRRFTLHLPEDPCYALVDSEALIKIMSNLFSNAIKYADKEITVTLAIQEAEQTLLINVASDGALLPIEQHEALFKPFTRFTQPDHVYRPGTGVGLYLARTLAELHEGSLKITTDNGLNTFVLRLPMHRAEATFLTASKVAVLGADTAIATKRQTILVAEDNADMQLFIQNVLQDKYEVLLAADGEAARKLLQAQHVSLVISDIMMPGMNGIDLCQSIKSDINYSHIPVLLLTAKTNVESKIEGMDVGADAYVEKPFAPNYLLAIIANLINSRDKMRESFLKNPMMMSSATTTNEADKLFLNNLRAAIRQQLQQADLKMEDLAESMNMSRASFYRKIKGLLDLTPNEYLRLERLKMAAQLIKENQHPIGEICYLVGFNSPSYFAKCFQEQFGMLPKDYR